MRSRFVFTCVAALLAAMALVPRVASASAFTSTWDGSEGDLAARAVIDYDGAGTLTITLSNRAVEVFGAGAASTVPADLLTGVYWDYMGTASLTAFSAFSAAGNSTGIAQVYNVSAWPIAAPNNGTQAGYDGNLGSEFAHRDNTTLTMDGFSGDYGVSSSGLGLFGPGDRFTGDDETPEASNVLHNPASPDGPNLGIVTTGFVDGSGNGGVDAVPLVRGEVIFTYTVSDGTLSEEDFADIFFHYGTSLTEPTFGGECSDCGSVVVPIPPAVGLAGLGLLMVVGRKVKKRQA